MTPSPWKRLEALNLNANLSDKLWSGYSKYVLAHCPRTADGYRLDEMADELLALATAWDIHRTF